MPNSPSTSGFMIRPATEADIDRIVDLDTRITGMPKREYWQGLFQRYGGQGAEGFLLVAMRDDTFLGFITGEIRAWEFGSPPCGWIFALGVEPGLRLEGIGTKLFDVLCDCFRKAGVTKIRTMIARDAQLVMSYFRSLGLRAGPFIELEKDLDE